MKKKVHIQVSFLLPSVIHLRSGQEFFFHLFKINLKSVPTIGTQYLNLLGYAIILEIKKYLKHSSSFSDFPRDSITHSWEEEEEQLPTMVLIIPIKVSNQKSLRQISKFSGCSVLNSRRATGETAYIQLNNIFGQETRS